MKKRISVWLAVMVLAAVALSAAAFAGDEHGTKAEAAKAVKADAQMTLVGELVDTGCYLSHGAMGEKHTQCATKCIANGMPMGLLTADGGLYLITMNHDNPDAYNALKKMAAKQVSISGKVSERNGMKGIDVVAAAAVDMTSMKEKASK